MKLIVQIVMFCVMTPSNREFAALLCVCAAELSELCEL